MQQRVTVIASSMASVSLRRDYVPWFTGTEEELVYPECSFLPVVFISVKCLLKVGLIFT